MSILPGKPSRAKLIAALMASDERLIARALSILEPAYGPVELSSSIFPFTYSDYYTKEMGEGLLKMFCSFRKLIEPDELVSFKLIAIECEKSFLRQANAGSPGASANESLPESPSQSPLQRAADEIPLDPQENTGQGPVRPPQTVAQKPGGPPQTTAQGSVRSPQTVAQRPGRRLVNIDPGYLDRTKLVLATAKDCSHRIYLGQGIYGDIELIYKSGSFACLDWTYPDYREALSIEFFNKVRSAYLAEFREMSQKVQQ